MPLNKEILLTGTLGRDPESKYTPKGKLLCEFSIAVSVGWGDNKTTEWYDCVAWEKKAEILQEHLSKGSRIQVRGDFKIETWSAKADGEAKAKLVVTVQDFQFLSSKRKEREESDEEQPEFMQD